MKESKISPAMRVYGRVHGQGDVTVAGAVHGDLSVEGDLNVLGEVFGEIRGRQVSLAGKVRGDVFADRIKLLKGADVIGDFYVNELEVEEGASFRGQVHHDKNAKADKNLRAKNDRNKAPRSRNISASTPAAVEEKRRESLTPVENLVRPEPRERTAPGEPRRRRVRRRESVTMAASPSARRSDSATPPAKKTVELKSTAQKDAAALVAERESAPAPKKRGKRRAWNRGMPKVDRVVGNFEN